MNIRYTAVAAGVLGALSQSVFAADLLAPIEVTAEQIPPSMTPVDLHTASPSRESADILRDIVGVSGSRMGGHGTDVSVRGQSQTRLNILLDGAYVHGGCPNRMDPPTAYANPGSYEEVTVIKGVQTLEYGGGGSGGTILFERKTQRFAADEGMRGSLEAGYRSNGGSWETVGDVAAGTPDAFVRLIASKANGENYDDGDGNEVRAAYEELSGTLIAGYTPDNDTRFEVSLERQRTDDLLFPGAGMDSPQSDNDAVRLKFQKENMPGVLNGLKAEIYRSEVSHLMDNYTLRPLTAPAQMRAPSTSDTTGGRVVFELESGIGQWKVGVDVQNNDRVADRFNDSMAGMRQSLLWPGVEIDQKGIFAELTHTLQSDDRVIAGVRFDRVDASAASAATPAMGGISPNTLYTQYYGVTAQDQQENNIGGLLRFEHDLADGRGTLFAGLSRSMRTADATERYMASNGMPNMRWVGNPEINPERHHQAEVGLLWRDGDWQADGSVFYNDVADYILRDRSRGVGGDNSTIYRNVDATLFGGEVNLNKRFNANWRGAVGLAYVHAHNDTDDRAIAQTPPLEAVVSADYRAASWSAGGRIRAAAKQSRVDLDPAVGSGLDARKTPAWAVLDLYGDYAVSDVVTVSFGMDNVFDRDYAQHLNRANSFDPTQVQVDEPGRSAWVKASVLF